MKLFKLIPIDHNHPSWKNSLQSDIALTIRAESELEARRLAVRKFFVIGKSCSLDASETRCPWMLANVVECHELLNDENQIPEIVSIEDFREGRS